MLVDKNLNRVSRPYQSADGTRHPRDIETKWTSGELAMRGWYRVHDDPRPPGAKRSESRLVWRKGEVWREWP